MRNSGRRSLAPALAVAAFVTAAGGCTRDPLPVGDDAAALLDGAMPVDGAAARDLAADLTAARDLAGESCAGIIAEVQRYLDAHAACQLDVECAVAFTRCGLPGTCGAYLARAAVAGLTPFDNAWDAARCIGPCPPCRFPDEAGCIGGRCQALGVTDRPVGASCSSAAACHSEGQYAALCLTAGQPPFPEGYCALACAHGNGCPLPGELCRTVRAGGASVSACFRQCSSDDECRVREGYRCCAPRPGDPGGPGNVCLPGPCPA